MVPVRQLTSKLTPRGWAMVGGSAAVAVVFIYLLFSLASKPSYTTLMAGIDPAQTGKITSTLSGKGIAYQLQSNGTAIAVQPGQVAQARVALAGAGLLSGQQPGMSLFDKASLGQSNFQQQVTYQRALEGQLANAIDSIQGVSSAQVQLVLPDPQSQLFADNSTPSSAAVLIGDSGSLDPSSVKGIARLVASSVQGLTTDHVTITDSTGALLWPTADSSAGGAGSPLTKQNDEAQYDAQKTAQLDAMLAATLGAGKAQVQVNADLNANQATNDTLTYAKKGVALTQHTDAETLSGTGAGTTGGVAGTTGTTVPTYAGGTGGNSKYNHKINDTTFGVDKSVTHTTIAPGAINRQSVSVLIDKSVPAASIPAIKAAVASAIGINATRGDTISVGQVAFTKPTTAAPAATGKMIGYAKYVVIALGAIFFLFFVTRLLRRRENEAFAGQPTWLRELESPRPLAALEAEQPAPTQVMQLRPPVNVAKRQVEDLVQREPDRVAAQLRAWMSED
jgi:flagellar M-ring protein FliF